MKATTPERITLIGFMGSGKTSVGRELARVLNAELIDIDRLIESREGMTINEIFEKRGETYFRDLERRTVEEMNGKKGPLIVCSGGGVILDARNVENIRKRGVSVWLKAKAETVYARIAEEGTRPVLNDDMSVEKITAVLEKRLPFYEAAADIAIDTDGKTIAQIGAEILIRLGSPAFDRPRP
ncbi:MAG: shikimate kinase [Treponemataceae bacterium]